MFTRKNGDVQKKEDSLPNPKDPLSFGVPGSAILLANREVSTSNNGENLSRD